MLRHPEPTKGRVEPTTLGIRAVEILIRPGSLFYCCCEFNVSPICGVITSPHYFFFSQA